MYQTNTPPPSAPQNYGQPPPADYGQQPPATGIPVQSPPSNHHVRDNAGPGSRGSPPSAPQNGGEPVPSAMKTTPPATGIPIQPPPNSYGPRGSTVPLGQNVQSSTTPGPWSTGLCDCFSDIPNCCVTWWCPCITFGQIAEIVDKGSPNCVMSGGLYALIGLATGCCCIYSFLYRARLRKQYLLPEKPGQDCLVHFCCEPCALSQEYRELKNRGFDMPIGWDGNVRKDNQGMQMAAPSVGPMGR